MLRGATTPSSARILGELLDYRTQYGNLFREAISRGRAEGVFSFDDLGIANQLMFMTLNSPIFWYSPRPGETEARSRPDRASRSWSARCAAWAERRSTA